MTYSSDELRDMLAAAIDAERIDAAAIDATNTVASIVGNAIRDAVSLARGADAAGLPIDLAAILAASIARATPVAPEVLATVVAPDAAPVAPVATAGANRRPRRRVERTWANVTSGTIWSCTLAGNDGRVKIVVDADGNGATFIATTGNRGSFRSPSRAVQSACGNPAGAGRKGEATVNGFVALVLADGAGGETKLDDVTAI